MPPSMHRPNRIAKGVLSLFACTLLAGGLGSCNNSGGSNNGSQTSLTLTPSTISLTAGAAGQQASLLLAPPAGRRAGDDYGVWPSPRGHDVSVDIVRHSWSSAASDVYGHFLGNRYNRD